MFKKWFNKFNSDKQQQEIRTDSKGVVQLESQDEDEWIWVEGFKGTESDMRCRDFQYKVGKHYYTNEDNVEMCQSGFHFCINLCDVFNYYEINFNFS